MATNIASLNINLFARTDRLVSGLSRAQTRLRSFGAGVRQIGAGIGRAVSLVGGPLAGLAGGGGLAVLTKSALQAGDALGKTADQLGLSTESLAALQFSAGLAGVETEALSKGLARMARSGAQAVQGLTEPKRAFDQLGINAERFVDLPLDEQLLRVARALRGVGNASQRVDIAQSLFGRSGIGLLSLLDQGEDALRAQAREAEALGLTISRVDARSFEETNDAVSKIGSSFRGLGNQLATNFGPLIEFVADNATDAIARMQGPVGAVAGGFKDLLRAALITSAGIASGFRHAGVVIEGVAQKARQYSIKGTSLLARAGAGGARALGLGAAGNALNAFARVGDLAAGAAGAGASDSFGAAMKGIAYDLDGMHALLDRAFATSAVPTPGSGAYLLAGDDEDEPNTEATRELTSAVRDLERELSDFKIGGASLSEIARNLRDAAFGLRSAGIGGGGR